ncbi:MAG: aspartate carbamoyltransferase catalytic subunit [Halobacteriovoraceae bacterium]|mgnify:CR=1 FL=1|jgi:aspartate carbamoyltransferase catalytic subunit|nr:aspartate carbamoyltransferase catalytic subunit [Halobacteriovoraceae bacterium]MBT5095564.1 aspartate carbamoyltransferase catalytic subunit [Halobacteriovoraceae bacterium]
MGRNQRLAFPPVLESITDLTKSQIDNLLSLAQTFKVQSKAYNVFNPSWIRPPTIVTSFLENSTRTKTSFAIAIQKLGASYIDFNTEKSSLQKGEGLEETLLTLANQGIDLIILRTSVSHQLAEFKENPPLKIINGGDGTHQHPTQALLDLLTMLEDGAPLKGSTLAIIGDCAHSRVGHSLIDLLPQFGIKIILCGPKEFLPEAAPNEFVTMTQSRDEAIEKSDRLYLLRIQKERHDGEATLAYESYPENYGVTYNLLEKMNKLIPVYHPGPANIGVEIGKCVMKSSLYQGYLQVKNSIYMRMAIVQSILEKGERNFGDDSNNHIV